MWITHLKAKFYISGTTKDVTSNDKFVLDSWLLTECIAIRIQITLRKQQWKHQSIQTADSEHFQSEIKMVSFNMTTKKKERKKERRKLFLAVALSIFLSERHYSGSQLH